MERVILQPANSLLQPAKKDGFKQSFAPWTLHWLVRYRSNVIMSRVDNLYSRPCLEIPFNTFKAHIQIKYSLSCSLSHIYIPFMTIKNHSEIYFLFPLKLMEFKSLGWLNDDLHIKLSLGVSGFIRRIL